jgi:UPF0176 protein
MNFTLDQRHKRIRELIYPLPGSIPYDNRRPLNVPQAFDRFTLIEFLCGYHPHLGREYWQQLCDSGRILCKEKPISANRIVRVGEQFVQVLPNITEPDVNANIRILHEEDDLVVVNKPAPLPMHPCGRFNRNTLLPILNQVYAPQKLLIVHRLDANTSGLVVFCRTKSSATILQMQFENREVKKTYLARVHGVPEKESFVGDVGISEKATQAGARLPDAKGLPSRTEFRLLEKYSDGTSLIEAKPITGRTNQIRLHLWDLNLPIVGDPVYLPHKQMGQIQTLGVNDPAMCLVAYRLEFIHPRTQEIVRLECPYPIWIPEPNQHSY